MNRFDHFPGNERPDPAQPVALYGTATVHPSQILVVLQFQAGQPGSLGTHIPQHMRSRGSVIVPAGEGRIEDDAGHIPALDLLLLPLRHAPNELHVLRTGSFAYALPVVRR